MTKAVLLLGSNIGDKREHLKKAIQLIAQKAGIIDSISNVYKTRPWGNPNQDDFYNMTLVLETELSPALLLKTILETETILGRTRSEEAYQPRTIDIDILFYGNEVVQSDALTIPHPHIASRRFTLMPLAEIMPGFVHPVLNKEIRNLLEECEDNLACDNIGAL
jgi:2-amino-4-hydroxy-6-hydroxymethyldihydropteridine diphosphokinase